MRSPAARNTRRTPIRIAVAALLAMAVLAALVLVTNLPSGDQPPGPASPEPSPPTTSAPAPAAGGPAVETSSFSGSGDVADDAAIWVDFANPANSVVIADNKADTGGGIGVFGMDGTMIHFRPDGKIGNVDLRTGFPLSGEAAVLVGGNNRTDDTLALWTLDPQTRELTPVAAGSIRTFAPNYGFCMYRSSASGKFYAFVTPNEEGPIQQFELVDDGEGRVEAELVRELPVSSITESCVADDELGHLYVAQEDVGVWKYNAEPDAGKQRTAVDKAGAGRLVADVEGMGISYGPGGSGHLFVSSQGDSTIAVYERSGDNKFVKKFNVGGNGDIDGVSGTDGLDVTALDAGPQFEEGLLVVHDEANSGGTTSNLKYIPLASVLE
ncbi:phytase [Pseudarthrobacter sp. NKDBFgelt]|uniref:phytase n=1 Tax=Pseudarthrobacter sp. NKDBFgelt TaxID=3384443 RepID=UPI0038D44325